ncbi:MAG: arginyl-tRNA synthetase [Pseudomonadota bacterium]|jgi:arginyl-tRNA synthetase
MNIYNTLKEDVIQVASELFGTDFLTQITIESPKDPLNGDLATNAAMVIANSIKRNPREIASELKIKLSQLPYVAHVEIAGPGFINFTIHSTIWQNNLRNIIKDGNQYGFNNVGNGKKVNVEYVSANPTGPMHIGHARGAVYGDVLARLLVACGYDVTKEYYINDAGSQIEALVRTALLRYKEAALKQEIIIPDGLYPGEYMVPVGKKLYASYKEELLHIAEVEACAKIRSFVLSEMMELIKNDLKLMGIEHDVFLSEQSLHDSGSIESVVERLKKDGLVYKGTLPPPKGSENKDWVPQELLLFKSTKYDDDQDRPIQKNDGSWAYFASDLAYAEDKIRRGFEQIIVVLGADHAGYVKRMEAIVHALSNGEVGIDIKLCQLVNFIEDGELVKMSKRAGSFTTVRDVINEVGKDIIRFIMLTRKNDVGLDFDLAKVKEQSRDNPVFYVNYAYVRAGSVINNAGSKAPEAQEIYNSDKADLSLLSSEEELHVMKLLALWPRAVEGAAINFEPHRIVLFMQNLASSFHALWNLGKENNNYRFVVEGDKNLTAARMTLAKAVQNVIHSGFDIVGTEPMEKM